MFLSAMKIQTRKLTYDGQKFLKKMIHQDTKKMQKLRDELADDDEIFDWEKEYDFKDEKKEAFGSDTDSFNSEISTEVLQAMVDQGLVSDEEGIIQEYASEEESSISSQYESESYASSSVKSNQTKEEDKMSFEPDIEEEKVEDYPYENEEGSKSFSSTDSSKRSRRIIEFDEDDQIIESKPKKGGSFQMVDLKANPDPEPKVFNARTTDVSYAQKKREKRLRKKQREEEEKLIADRR